MTWCLSHITEEQMKKVIEHTNEKDIDGIMVETEPKYVLIKSGGQIILANSPEINLELHKAMNE